jgi:YD repeat-containing protein
VPTGEQFPQEADQVRITMRIDRPDGTSVETAWDDSGQVTTTHLGAGGEVRARTVSAFDVHGSFSLDDVPEQVVRDTNPFGAAVERVRHRDGTVIERAYDAEATLRRVRVAGAWGAQALELRPDGSRSLRWHTAGLRGARHWDAAGTTTAAVTELVTDDLTEHTWDF